MGCIVRKPSSSTNQEDSTNHEAVTNSRQNGGLPSQGALYHGVVDMNQTYTMKVNVYMYIFCCNDNVQLL